MAKKNNTQAQAQAQAVEKTVKLGIQFVGNKAYTDRLLKWQFNKGDGAVCKAYHDMFVDACEQEIQLRLDSKARLKNAKGSVLESGIPARRQELDEEIAELQAQIAQADADYEEDAKKYKFAYSDAEKRLADMMRGKNGRKDAEYTFAEIYSAFAEYFKSYGFDTANLKVDGVKQIVIACGGLRAVNGKQWLKHDGLKNVKGRSQNDVLSVMFGFMIDRCLPASLRKYAVPTDIAEYYKFGEFATKKN